MLSSCAYPFTKSPCCGLCKLDTSGSYCLGCFRTRTDIGSWSGATEAERIVINRRALLRAERINAGLKKKED